MLAKDLVLRHDRRAGCASGGATAGVPRSGESRRRGSMARTAVAASTSGSAATTSTARPASQRATRDLAVGGLRRRPGRDGAARNIGAPAADPRPSAAAARAPESRRRTAASAPASPALAWNSPHARDWKTWPPGRVDRARRPSRRDRPRGPRGGRRVRRAGCRARRGLPPAHSLGTPVGGAQPRTARDPAARADDARRTRGRAAPRRTPRAQPGRARGPTLRRSGPRGRRTPS